jgi:hypothetical protein
MMRDVDSDSDDGSTRWLANYPQVEQSSPDIVRAFGRDARSWDLKTRLAMRSHPIFSLTGLRHRVQKLAHDLDRVRNLTRDLDLAADLTHDLTYARARDHARDLTRDFIRAGARAGDLTRDLDLVRHLDLVRGHDLAHDLDLVGDFAVDLVHALDLALDFAHARDRALAHAHALGLSLTYGTASLFALGFGLSFAHTLTLARDRDRDAYRALILARDRALALDRALERALDRDGTAKALMNLHHALSDVTKHDLRGIELAGNSLAGLRWSSKTQWPRQWEDQIRCDSIALADGTFQIVSSCDDFTGGQRTPEAAGRLRR